MKMNGKEIPPVGYRPNFPTNDYTREYFAIFEGLGIDILNEGINLMPDQWAFDYPLFIFGTALPAPINIICFSEYASLLELDRAHNLLTF